MREPGAARQRRSRWGTQACQSDSVGQSLVKRMEQLCTQTFCGLHESRRVKLKRVNTRRLRKGACAPAPASTRGIDDLARDPNLYRRQREVDDRTGFRKLDATSPGPLPIVLRSVTRGLQTFSDHRRRTDQSVVPTRVTAAPPGCGSKAFSQSMRSLTSMQSGVRSRCTSITSNPFLDSRQSGNWSASDRSE